MSSRVWEDVPRLGGCNRLCKELVATRCKQRVVAGVEQDGREEGGRSGRRWDEGCNELTWKDATTCVPHTIGTVSRNKVSH